jgi:hypothetical protein
VVSAPSPVAVPDETPGPQPPAAPVRAAAKPEPRPARAASVPADVYPWLADASLGVPPPADALEDRFAPPPAFVRVELAAGSFGAWLRRLPLAPPGTSVLSYRGDLILPSDHGNLAAVVALDVGLSDLQQCADSVIRLHAEWLWSVGRRDQSYRAAAGGAMPFARWAAGERVRATPEGRSFSWIPSARPDASHTSFRRYLDTVFAFANTGSLARDTRPIAPDELQPGDFVVQPGAPGHAVLVLDLARAPDGRRAVLLGQGFMPAQSFQVLRPSSGGAWFIVEPAAEALRTPFWAPFPWRTLRRFDGM